MAKEPKDCLCGCGNQTKGGRFLPGHDAVLKSRLVRSTQEGGKRDRDRAVKQLTELGWEHYIPQDAA